MRNSVVVVDRSDFANRMSRFPKYGVYGIVPDHYRRRETRVCIVLINFSFLRAPAMIQTQK